MELVMRSLDPMFGGPALLLPGDAVSTTRTLAHDKWEPATYLGVVTERPVKVNGRYQVFTDSGDTFPIRDTQTLAIWPDL